MKTDRHRHEIEFNRDRWLAKPLLKEVYGDIHRRVAEVCRQGREPTVEIGSGIGHIKETIPECITTDTEVAPGIDQKQNIYKLTFEDASVGNFILIHVLHHLQYPGTALEEMRRVLVSGGRIVIFEPYISMLGRIVYGPCHHEPIGLHEPIEWFCADSVSSEEFPYYAAQGNATRIFARTGFESHLENWLIVKKQVIAHFSHILSGGYGGPCFYPRILWPLMRKLDVFASLFPSLFGTSVLIALEKR